MTIFELTWTDGSLSLSLGFWFSIVSFFLFVLIVDLVRDFAKVKALKKMMGGKGQ